MDLILNITRTVTNKKPLVTDINKEKTNDNATVKADKKDSTKLTNNSEIEKNSTKKAIFLKKTNLSENNKTEKIPLYNAKKASLVMDEDCHIKDMEELMSSSKGTKYEPVFSDKTFNKFKDLHPHLVKTLSDRMSITMATAIQDKAIPALLNGRDALIKSATGSGKTLSYAIPMVNALQALTPHISRDSGIHALIISPTRELAVQTQDVLTKLTNPFVRIVTGTLIGGVKGQIQKRALRKGLNILIVTPNRLLHHMDKTSKLDMSKLKWLVIDEADRLAELGFGDNVSKVIAEIGRQRDMAEVQTVLLSATLSKGVENMAGLALKEPFRAEVEFVKAEEPKKVTENQEGSKEDDKEENDDGNTKGDAEEGELSNFLMPKGLEHFLLVCPTKLRMVALISFLLLKCKYGKHTGKVVVFMTTQDLVEFHYQLFSQFLGEKCLVGELPNADKNDLARQAAAIEMYQLHGGMEHDKRQAVYKQFSACRNGFLLTTDVCSRGVDLAGVSWVVQYHPPGRPVDYIHRVGRTARAGTSGKALLFLQPSEVNYVHHLQSAVGGLLVRKVAMRAVLQAALYHAGDTNHRSVHTVEESIFLTAKILEGHVAGDPVLQGLARAAFTSLVGSYAAFSKETRQFFCYADLHLGHVAKSLACTETPRQIATRAVRNDAGDLPVDKRKKVEMRGKRKASSTVSMATVPKKGRQVDQAHRNMLAEFGL